MKDLLVSWKKLVYNAAMNEQTDYSVLVQTLLERFGERLRMIVLFGSHSRGEERPDSDHDILVVIEGLPRDPLARQREVMAPLLPQLLGLPQRLSVIAKTPEELHGDLTPLMVDVCVDGISLYGQSYFDGLRNKVMQALRAAGLQRRRLAGTWMWMFPSLPQKDWAVTWEGYRERV
ncbi:MAG: nucleotidyltransferase domain-containing protein [Anaerolineae bacterium]